ncbi:hypothetical protein J5Y04_02465 [Kitasatospora sp. RG8]|uniref:hypothetical protein n=1 Tax=Kitasatospora sp. RG8 TaxID=2820815 RepID=UPI001ADFC604|nr:hypothetical protein [Kitasatospora sp. RG8]MBP0448416.1 hypothetical protein [Kitasatospora sp. RG8]
MVGLVLVGILAAVIGGCVCVVWADRGGPRWARVVARLTVGAGRMLRRYQKQESRSVGRSSDDGL